MKLILLAIFCLLGFSQGYAGEQPAQDEVTVPEELGLTEKAIWTAASDLLDVLRAEKWEESVNFVSLDEVTRSRMAIPKDATDEVIREKVKTWFQRLYGRIKPGPVSSVRIHSEDLNLASIGYRHSDNDGFNMRRVGDKWLYSLDWKPRRQ